MNTKKDLTGEFFSKKYTNTFRLINEAIELSHLILEKEKPYIAKSDVLNTSYRVLLEIAEGNKDLFSIEEETEEDGEKKE